MYVDIVVHLRPIVAVFESFQNLEITEMASNLATMVEVKQLLSQRYWYINAIMFGMGLPIIEYAVELLTIWLHGMSWNDVN